MGEKLKRIAGTLSDRLGLSMVSMKSFLCVLRGERVLPRLGRLKLVFQQRQERGSLLFDEVFLHLFFCVQPK